MFDSNRHYILETFFNRAYAVNKRYKFLVLKSGGRRATIPLRSLPNPFKVVEQYKIDPTSEPATLRSYSDPLPTYKTTITYFCLKEIQKTHATGCCHRALIYIEVGQTLEAILGVSEI